MKHKHKNISKIISVGGEFSYELANHTQLTALDIYSLKICRDSKLLFKNYQYYHKLKSNKYSKNDKELLKYNYYNINEIINK